MAEGDFQIICSSFQIHFLNIAVLWDGRPPQCPLCLCLKVLPGEFLKERIKRSIIQLMDVFFRDPGLDLRVEHSHGWGENNQVGFLPLISMKQIFDFQRRGDWSDLGLITGWALPLRHNPWWCWIPGILQHRWGKSESKFLFLHNPCSALLPGGSSEGDSQSWPMCGGREWIVFSDFSIFSKVTHMVGRD